MSQPLVIDGGCSLRSGMRQALIFTDRPASVGAAIPANDPPFFVDGVYVPGLGGLQVASGPSIVFNGKCEPVVISISGEHKAEHVICGNYEFFDAGVLSASVRKISNLMIVDSYDICEQDVMRAIMECKGSIHFSSNVASAQMTTPALPALMAQLSEIVGAITSSQPPPSVSPEFDTLLDKAIACQGTPDNIEEWAAHIADQVSDLTD
jgi:hypothetical protein